MDHCTPRGTPHAQAPGEEKGGDAGGVKSFAMKLRALPLIGLVSGLAGCSVKDARLLGTWQSDREATERYLTSELKVSPKTITTLGKVLGQMRITYTASSVVLENCEMAGTYSYKIVASTGDDLKIQLIGADGERGPVSTIRFVNGSEFLSIPSQPQIPGYRETFKKINNGAKP